VSACNATVDVAVVGAGLAGLVAARQVRRAGRSVVVLEARDRVGGRLLNASIGDGKVVEVGGQWVGPTQKRVLALAREVGVDTYATHAAGRNLIEWRSRLIRYRGAIPRINAAVLLDVAQAQARVDRMARQVPLDAPWMAPKAELWDGQTFETWLRRNVATAGARELLRIAVEAVWAADAADVSLLHLLFYTHSAGSFDDLIGTEGGAQQDRFVGGSQLLALKLAEELGDVVALEAPVRRIEHSESGVRLVADDREATAGAAIVAIPPALCGRIAYDPPLPAIRDQLTQRMPQGTVIKCMAAYERPFWREAGLSGQAMSSVGPVKVMSTTPRRTVHQASCWDSWRDVRHASWGSGTQKRAGGRSSAAFRASSARRPRSRWTTWSEYGRRRSGPAAATAATCRPEGGSATGEPFAARSAASTGPARRRPPCGTATWTARCSPASAPPRRF
jgi:monoamine oxidase